MTSATFGLHRLPEPELKRLLRALHRGVFTSPITRSSLIEKAFGHIEGHLDLVVGREVASAKALVIAVLAERTGERGHRGAVLSYSGPPAPGTRSRDLVDQVRELLASAKTSAHLYGLRVGADEGLFGTINALVAGRDAVIRLVFDGAGLPDALEDVRAFATSRLNLLTGVEVFVTSAGQLRARAAVVDDSRALVTSGDLTGREEDGYIDVGVVLDDPSYVRALREEWERLIATERCVPVPLQRRD
jgi:hypothetical protein